MPTLRGRDGRLTAASLRRVRLNDPTSGFLGAPVETDPDRIDADAVILGVPHGWPYPRRAPRADAPRPRPRSGGRAARHAGFRGHWDFDLDGPMLAADGRPRSWTPATCLATRPTERATRAARRRRWPRSSNVARCRSASAATTRCPSRSCAPSRATDRSRSCRSTLTSTSATRSTASARATRRRCAGRPRWSTCGASCRSGCAAGSARPSDVEDARAAGNLLVTAREVRERGRRGVLDSAAARRLGLRRSTATGSIRRSSRPCPRWRPVA